MNPSIGLQQRRVVSALVRRNIQGWGRPLDFTVQRLRLGALFGGLAAVLYLVLRLILARAPGSFLTTALTFAIILSLAILVSFLFTHVVPFVRAVSQPQTTIQGKIEAAICNPNDYTPVAHNDYHFITLRLANGVLRPYAIEADKHAEICAQKGQQVKLRVIPGIERVVSVA